MNSETRNIVLIGMPGCGKTTIGKLLAARLGRKLIDIDAYIEKVQGCTINEIFELGEETFRRLETEAVLALEQERSAVITTGGGVVKNPMNMSSLKKNSIIVYIDRSIESITGDIDTSTRPLLAQGKSRLEGLYAERHELYSKYCDFIAKNEGLITDTVDSIISLMDMHKGGRRNEDNGN